jgi:hypothetical protein
LFCLDEERLSSPELALWTLGFFSSWEQNATIITPSRCEYDQSLPSCGKVKNAWRYTSTPLCIFMTWFLIKHRDNFIFLLHSLPHRAEKRSNSYLCASQKLTTLPCVIVSVDPSRDTSKLLGIALKSNFRTSCKQNLQICL